MTTCGLAEASGHLQWSMLSTWGTLICPKTVQCGRDNVLHHRDSPSEHPQRAHRQLK